MLGEYLINTLSKSQRAEAVGSHHATDDPSDDDSLLTDSGLVQRLLTNPGVLLFLTLTVIALVAERSLLAGTPLGGGALVPAWGGASGLWQEYLQGYHPVSIGTAAGTPPYVLVLAILATLLGGKPWLAVDVILLGCVPLAGISAFLATRRVTRFVPARIVGALAYALLPVGIGAVATGRLGTAVLLVLLPPIGVLAGRVFAGPRRKARRAAWALALLVAVVAAFVPLFWLITVVAMAVGVLALGRRRPGTALNAGIVAAVPLVLLLPWTLDLATDPARIFLEAGVVRSGLATPGLAARSLLLLSPGGPGLPPFWVTVGLAAAAAAALVLASRRQAALVLAGWIVGVTGLIFAALVSHVSVTQAGPAGAVPAWPGPALAVAGAGLLLALVAASDRIPGELRSGGWRNVTALAVLGLGVLACSAPALAAAYWISSGVTGPVRPTSGQLLPEFVAVSSDSGLRLRTLVLQTAPGGRVTYTVLRDADPLIGSQELPLPTSAQRALNLCVATLTAPAGSAAADQGRVLASYGIGYVLLPAPINANLARQLDGVPGLRPVSVTGQFDLWRVVNTTAQVTVAEPGGKVAAVASGPVSVAGARAPAAGGTLMLAAPAGGWSASLNGHPLTPLAAAVGGWAQGFRLPPGGGSLSVSRSEVPREAVLALTGLAALVVAGLGLPGARAAAEAERKAAQPRPGDEELSAEEDEELAEPGRRASRSRDKGHDRAGRRRSSRRGRAAPQPSAATEVLRPAAPAPVASRLRGAVPAGVRAGWPRRGGAPADAEAAFADELDYADGPAYQDSSVPGRPGAGELTAQTAAFGAHGSNTAGRHGYQADRDEPAGRDSGRRPGPQQDFGRPRGHRRRPGGADPAPSSDVAPLGRWARMTRTTAPPPGLASQRVTARLEAAAAIRTHRPALAAGLVRRRCLVGRLRAGVLAVGLVRRRCLVGRLRAGVLAVGLVRRRCLVGGLRAGVLAVGLVRRRRPAVACRATRVTIRMRGGRFAGGLALPGTLAAACRRARVATRMHARAMAGRLPPPLVAARRTAGVAIRTSAGVLAGGLALPGRPAAVCPAAAPATRPSPRLLVGGPARGPRSAQVCRTAAMTTPCPRVVASGPGRRDRQERPHRARCPSGWPRPVPGARRRPADGDPRRRAEGPPGGTGRPAGPGQPPQGGGYRGRRHAAEPPTQSMPPPARPGTPCHRCPRCHPGLPAGTGGRAGTPTRMAPLRSRAAPRVTGGTQRPAKAGTGHPMTNGPARSATSGTNRTGDRDDGKPDAAARRGGPGSGRGRRAGRVEPHPDGRGWSARPATGHRAGQHRAAGLPGPGPDRIAHHSSRPHRRARVQWGGQGGGDLFRDQHGRSAAQRHPAWSPVADRGAQRPGARARQDSSCQDRTRHCLTGRTQRPDRDDRPGPGRCGDPGQRADGAGPGS